MTLPEQTYFYCKHKRAEVPMKVAKSETLYSTGSTDPLVIITFMCPGCSREILYKISLSAMQRFWPAQNPR